MYKLDINTIIKKAKNMGATKFKDIAEILGITLYNMSHYITCRYTTVYGQMLESLIKNGYTMQDIFITGRENKAYVKRYFDYVDVMQGKDLSFDAAESDSGINFLLEYFHGVEK